MSQPFTPTLKWHVKVLACLLVACIIAWIGVVVITKRLPPPYQHKTPAAELTPWLHPEVNK